MLNSPLLLFAFSFKLHADTNHVDLLDMMTVQDHAGAFILVNLLRQLIFNLRYFFSPIDASHSRHLTIGYSILIF